MNAQVHNALDTLIEYYHTYSHPVNEPCSRCDNDPEAASANAKRRALLESLMRERTSNCGD